MADRQHLCHAYCCAVSVPPRMHMCPEHWRMVPRHLQSALWANYRRGQERDMQPSAAYLHAAAMCVQAVARKEGHPEHEIDREMELYTTWAEMLEEATSDAQLVPAPDSIGPDQ